MVYFEKYIYFVALRLLLRLEKFFFCPMGE